MTDHHHNPLPGQDDPRYRDIRNVTLVGMAVNIVVAVARLVFGVIGQSQALIADGIHAVSDIGSDFLVLFAARHSSRAADESHPYGHERIETIATVGLGLSLIAVAGTIAWDAVDRLFHPEELMQPGWLALIVAALSIFAKEGVYWYTVRAANRLKSSILKANAWHSRVDGFSAVIVVIGVAGSMAGLTYMDAVAAIVVAAIIAKVGWEFVWNNLQELADAALDQDRVAAIRKTILTIGGVRSVHMLRTRRMGGNAFVDVHVLVEPTLSVSEGHYISEKVRTTLIREIEEVADVTVHIDPEDDERFKPSLGLPSRDEMVKRLRHHWRFVPEAAHIEDIRLHYLNGRVHVEILLPLNILASNDDAGRVAGSFSQALVHDAEIAGVEAHFH